MNLKIIGSNMTQITFNHRQGLVNVLFSYNTPVACDIADLSTGVVNHYKTSKHWSRTTTKHINKWLGSSGLAEMPQEWFDNLIKGLHEVIA